CDHALKLNPKAADAFVGRARVFANGDADFDKAIMECQRALELEPENSEALVGLGFSYGKKGEHGKALKFLGTAIKADPKSSTAFAVRAFVNYCARNMEGARADSDEALRLDSEDTRAIASFLFEEEGKLDDAIGEANKLIRLDPKDANGFLIRGRSRLRQLDTENPDRGAIQEALADLERALRALAKLQLRTGRSRTSVFHIG